MTVATDPQQPPVSGQPPVTMLNPDFPFSYDLYLEHPAGLGSVPPERYGTEVAVIGARAVRPRRRVRADEAGPAARCSTRPTRSADGCAPRASRRRPTSWPDLGGMRFPRLRPGLLPLRRPAGPGDAAFPNPLAAATSSTVIELAGTSHYARTSPATCRSSSTRSPTPGSAALNDGARLHRDAGGHPGTRHGPDQGDLERAARRSWTRRRSTASSRGAKSFKDAGFAHREAFGQVGFGTGGWDTDFPNSILEILRVVYTDADDEHRGSSAERSGCPRRSGTTRRRTSRTGRQAPRWPRCTTAPRTARWPGSPGNPTGRSASGALGPGRQLPRGGDHLPVLAAARPGSTPRRRSLPPKCGRRSSARTTCSPRRPS